MKVKREVGIHLRIKKNYKEIAAKGKKLGASALQFFLMPQDSDKYLKPTKEDQEGFLKISQKHFSNSYIHSSYWVAPANGKEVSAKVSVKYLKREIAIAKQLEIKTIVFHAGAASGFPFNEEEPDNRTAGIKAVANVLNTILKNEKNITLLLENTTHGNKMVCSDFYDFVKLKPLLHFPEQVGFCLDTAHAYAYGYDITHTDDFLDFLDETMGIENIKLIHLNDSEKELGSKLDKHALVNEGLIEKEFLKKIVNHEKLKHVPIILEPPEMDEKRIKKIIKEVQRW